MASSLETNKLVAGVLTAGIIAVGSGVIASILYHPRGLEENAFNVIEIETEAEGAETVAAAEVSLATLLASADPAAGETLGRQCTACHVFEEGGDNRVGPGLWNVVGADIAAHDGFAYSDALAGIEGDWTYEALDGFLAAPRDWAPGTAMSYAGIRDAQDRANMIAYLQTLSNDPVPLPEPAAEEPAAEETAASEEPAAEEAVAEETVAEEPVESEETAVVEAEAEEAAEADVAATEVPAESEETAIVEAEAEETAEAAAAAGTEAVAEAEEPVVAEAEAEEAVETETAAVAAAGAEAVVEAEEPVVAEAVAEEAAEAEAAATAEAGTEAVVEAEEPVVAEAEAEEAAEAAAPAAEAAGEASPMVAMVAAADPADGERQFRQCAACHVPDQGGANRVGPGLWGVFGADIASHDGFNYSDALQGLEGNWTVDKLNAYLENPRGFAPGNRMAFAGLRSEEDRAAMIAYLHSLSENPVPLQ